MPTVARSDAVVGDAQFFHADRHPPIERLGIAEGEVLRVLGWVGRDFLPERETDGRSREEAVEEAAERVAHAPVMARFPADGKLAVGHPELRDSPGRLPAVRTRPDRSRREDHGLDLRLHPP